MAGMTENEAKKRLCHRTIDAHRMEALCRASGCMAWRWVEDAEHNAAADAEFRKTGERIHPDRGYCGLIGPSS